MRAERAQAIVEAVAVLPICLACALVIVDCGVVVRDRVAVAQAAGRAAEVELRGGDPVAVARGAVPAGIRDSVEVDDRGDELVVTARSRATVLRIPGGIVHRSRVELGSGGAR